MVNARHLKNVPGYKIVSGCSSCIAMGCSRRLFGPAEEMRVLRTYLRQRTMLIENRATHIQHMQKALQQMNVLVDASGE